MVTVLAPAFSVTGTVATPQVSQLAGGRQASASDAAPLPTVTLSVRRGVLAVAAGAVGVAGGEFVGARGRGGDLERQRVARGSGSPRRSRSRCSRLWSLATDTPLRFRPSASHSAPNWQDGVGGGAQGSAVTACLPARSVMIRLPAVNGPEPTLYRSCSWPVSMVSQPFAVFCVKCVGAKPSRPMALNVGSSSKAPLPAYSVRMRVGERTSKRALPETTACLDALGVAADGRCRDRGGHGRGQHEAGGDGCGSGAPTLSSIGADGHQGTPSG